MRFRRGLLARVSAMSSAPARLCHAPLTQIAPATLLQILRVRQDVFIVEQECPYPDIDDVDAHPLTLHHWAQDAAGVVLAVMRSYTSTRPGQAHIGRVATHPAARGRGLASALMGEAIDRVGRDFPGCEIQIGAQSYLRAWYEGFGYRVCGPEYLEDGIAHLPMVRAASGRVPSDG